MVANCECSGGGSLSACALAKALLRSTTQQLAVTLEIIRAKSDGEPTKFVAVARVPPAPGRRACGAAAGGRSKNAHNVISGSVHGGESFGSLLEYSPTRGNGSLIKFDTLDWY